MRNFPVCKRVNIFFDYTVNSGIFVKILLSRITLKDIIVMLKNRDWSMIHVHVPTSVNCREISQFREGFIFTKLRACEVSRK